MDGLPNMHPREEDAFTQYPGNPVETLPTETGSANGVGTSRRVQQKQKVKKLTARRRRIITAFLTELSLHPNRYTGLNEDAWVAELIRRFDEHPGRPGLVSEVDVKHWLRNAEFGSIYASIKEAAAAWSSSFSASSRPEEDYDYYRFSALNQPAFTVVAEEKGTAKNIASHQRKRSGASSYLSAGFMQHVPVPASEGINGRNLETSEDENGDGTGTIYSRHLQAPFGFDKGDCVSPPLKRWKQETDDLTSTSLKSGGDQRSYGGFSQELDEEPIPEHGADSMTWSYHAQENQNRGEEFQPGDEDAKPQVRFQSNGIYIRFPPMSGETTFFLQPTLWSVTMQHSTKRSEENQGLDLGHQENEAVDGATSSSSDGECSFPDDVQEEPYDLSGSAQFDGFK